MKHIIEYIQEEQFLENYINENNILIEEGRIIKAISRLFRKIFNIEPKDKTDKKEKPYFGSYGYFSNNNSKYNISVKNGVTKIDELKPSDIDNKEKYQFMSYEDVRLLKNVVNGCTMINNEENDEKNTEIVVQGFPRFKNYVDKNMLKGANRTYASLHIDKNNNVLPCIAVMIIDKVDDESKIVYNIFDIEFIQGLDDDLEKKLNIIENNVIIKVIKSLKNDNKGSDITITYDSNSKNANANNENKSFVKALKENGFTEDNHILSKTI